MSSNSSLNLPAPFAFGIDPNHSTQNVYHPLFLSGAGDPATGFPIAAPLGGTLASVVQLGSTLHIVGYVDGTSLTDGDYGLPLILDKIFALLASMITSLQNVTASQANRLTFLTNWQTAYTNQMNQVKAFVANDSTVNTVVSGSVTDSNNIRQGLNQTNSTYTTEMQGNRQTISDAAQALQSNVNQSNDAVNQQSNLATSILQEFQTILTSIYQS